MIRNCVECGKEFEVSSRHYKICSDECQKARNARRRREKYCEIYRAERRSQYMKNIPVVLCKLCGEPVPPEFIGERICRKHYHDECIVNQAVDALIECANYNDARLQRARNYGYSKLDLIKIRAEQLKAERVAREESEMCKCERKI